MKNLADKIEKRRNPRIRVKWPITILTNGSKIEGEIRNISKAGILILPKEPLCLYELYRVHIRPPNCQSRELTCKVIWSDLYGIDSEDEDIVYGIGFCFVKISVNKIRRIQTK